MPPPVFRCPDHRDLADAVSEQYDWATAEHLDAVIATDSKGRLEREAGRVRAAYQYLRIGRLIV